MILSGKDIRIIHQSQCLPLIPLPPFYTRGLGHRFMVPFNERTQKSVPSGFADGMSKPIPYNGGALQSCIRQ